MSFLISELSMRGCSPGGRDVDSKTRLGTGFLKAIGVLFLLWSIPAPECKDIDFWFFIVRFRSKLLFSAGCPLISGIIFVLFSCE